MKKIYVSINLPKDKKARLEEIKGVKFVYEKDYEADAVIGNLKPEDIKNFKNLKWLQLSAVGYDAYIKKDVLNEGTILTNAVDVHSKEVAEHVFGLMMSLIKKINLYKNNQRNHLWNDEGKVKSITDLRVCIVGMGNIGKNIAALLKPLGNYVIGVKRTITEVTNVDEVYSSSDLDKAISNVDVVISVLPGTKENAYLFNLDTFKKMRKDTIFINAGRGNLYKEEDLYKALNEGIILAAASDVYEKEPLPSESKLWDLDNFIVTPHVAGYFHLDSALDKYLDLAIENTKRFLADEELKYIVTERE